MDIGLYSDDEDDTSITEKMFSAVKSDTKIDVNLNDESVLEGENLEDPGLLKHMKNAREQFADILDEISPEKLRECLGDMRAEFDELNKEYTEIRDFVINIFTYMCVARRGNTSVLDEHIRNEDALVKVAKNIEKNLILVRRNFELLTADIE